MLSLFGASNRLLFHSFSCSIATVLYEASYSTAGGELYHCTTHALRVIRLIEDWETLASLSKLICKLGNSTIKPVQTGL